MRDINSRKVAIIGCGFVGSASAFALMQSGLFSEMVLVDADRAKAEGEALDISHGLPFAKPMTIYDGSYDDITDAAIIVITAGAAQKPGETRLDLIHNACDFCRAYKFEPQIHSAIYEAESENKQRNAEKKNQDEGFADAVLLFCQRSNHLFHKLRK